MKARIRNISYNVFKEMRSVNSLPMTTTQYCILIISAINVLPAKSVKSSYKVLSFAL